MIIDTSITIAYKCPSCGTFDFFCVSLFKLVLKKEYKFTCRCGYSQIIISHENLINYKIIIPCIGCSNEHSFILGRREILQNEINILFCPEMGMQLCFIGNDNSVRTKIDNVEKELDELINMFGYDNYFSNTQVMFDSLNKIHDIAEQENLLCDCGNNDIELILLPDRIILKCKKCFGSIIINAASNRDLKEILKKDIILLHKGLQNDCDSTVLQQKFASKIDEK